MHRYLPNSEARLLVCAIRSTDGFLDQFDEHLSGLTDPVAAIVEG